jgi:hypothetical protein
LFVGLDLLMVMAWLHKKLGDFFFEFIVEVFGNWKKNIKQHTLVAMHCTVLKKSVFFPKVMHRMNVIT